MLKNYENKALRTDDPDVPERKRKPAARQPKKKNRPKPAPRPGQ
jgi:hypothetical protein